VSTLEDLAWVPQSTAWLWAIAATVTAVIGLGASIRVAADNERIVVLRQVRPHRVRGRRLVLLVPVLDRGGSVPVAHRGMCVSVGPPTSRSPLYPACCSTWQSALVVVIASLKLGKVGLELQPTGGGAHGLC